MSLTSIGSLASLTTPSLFGVTSSTAIAPSADAGASAVSSSTGAGRFATALQDAFASLGISLDATGSTSNAATSSTDSPSADSAGDAVSAFVQSLFAALHSQSGGSATPADDSTSQAAAVGHAHHGHHGKLAADLQNLISELGSSSTATDSAATGTPGATASTSSSTGDSTLATLEKNFDALVAQNGASSAGGNATLTTFLQAFASGLNGAPATGNVVSTAA